MPTSVKKRAESDPKVITDPRILQVLARLMASSQKGAPEAKEGAASAKVGGAKRAPAAERRAAKAQTQGRAAKRQASEAQGGATESQAGRPAAAQSTESAKRDERRLDFDAPRWGPSECYASPECIKQYIPSPEHAAISAMLLDRVVELSSRQWDVPGGKARRIGHMYNRIVVETESPPPGTTPSESNTAVLGRREDGKVFGLYIYEVKNARPRLREVFFRADCDEECVERIKRAVREAPGEAVLRERLEPDYKLYEYDFGDVQVYVYDYAGSSYIVVEAVYKGRSLGSGAVYSPILSEEELAATMKTLAESLSRAVGKKRAEQLLKAALEDLFNLPERSSYKEWLQKILKVLKLAFSRR